MILTLAENAALLLSDPTGSKQRQIANAIEQLPAQKRLLASLKSAAVAALNRGVSKQAVANAWQAIVDADQKLMELDRIARIGWAEMVKRGAAVGECPSVTIAEPDTPGLSGFASVAAIAGAIALGIAALFASGALAVALLAAAVVLGVVAAIQSLVDIAKERTAQLGMLAANPQIAPQFQTTATGKSGKSSSLFNLDFNDTGTLLAVGGGLALLALYFSRPRS